MEESLNGRWIEWDDEKNIHNHGISFQAAKYVFNDENRLEFFDAYHSDDEDRYITIGKVHDVLFVVFTERGESIRLISARIANARERRIYYGND